ncbi:MAG: hypothetical protein AABZ08_11765 [Planctomycetota bacterium]
MVAPSFQRELLEQLSNLSDIEQRRVLEFARLLGRSTTTGEPGSNLLQWAGSISREDVRLMDQAIKDGCERIDADGWNAPS